MSTQISRSPQSSATADDLPYGAVKRSLVFVSNLFPDTTAPYLGLDNATLLHALESLHGWQVQIISPRPALSLARYRTTNGGWSPREQDAGWQPVFVPVPYVPKIGSRFNHLLMAAGLRPAMREIVGEFDVVLASWLYPDGWAAARIADDLCKPSVLITQGSDTHQYLRNPVRRRAIIEAASRCRGVIARSRNLADRLAQAGVNEDHLHPIYNGVDTLVFRQLDRMQMRDELRVSHDATVLLFVGNLLPVKNPALLLKAFARFQAERENAILVMVGNGPLREALDELAHTLGITEKVRFTGGIEATQIAQWMNAADWLCLSSQNEGLPNVLLEAFACGLPVLATAVGGIHELLNEEWLGALTPSGDLPGYVRSLHRMDSVSWNRSAIAAKGAQHSWANCAGAYDRVLRAALR